MSAGIFLAIFSALQGAFGAENEIPAPVSEPILITAFEPFGGNYQNGSLEAARVLVSDLIAQGVPATLCILPVEFGMASKRAIDCVDEMSSPPSRVFSMGESYCGIAIETRAVNTWVDIDSLDTTPHPIREDRGGDSAIALSQSATLYCALPPEMRDDVRISRDAGDYVCNETSYLLSEELQKARGIPFSFVHVPNTDCYQHKLMQIHNTVDVLRTMILGAQGSEVQEWMRDESLEPCPELEAHKTPADNVAQDLEPVLDAIKGSLSDDPCRREFEQAFNGAGISAP